MAYNGPYADGKVITLGGRTYHIEAFIKRHRNYFLMKASDGEGEFMLKVLEITDAEDAEARCDRTNLLRQAGFQFSYPFIVKIYGLAAGKNCDGTDILGVRMDYIQGEELKTWRRRRIIESGVLENHHIRTPEDFEREEEDAEDIYRKELMNGETLVKDSADEIRVFGQMLQLLRAMSYYLRYEGRPYFHRDIKPENIMIDDEGRVVLIDFDFSHLAGSSGTVNLPYHNLGYSPGYSSPSVHEHVRGKAHTYPAEAEDIYSAGRVFFYWLNGYGYFTLDELDRQQGAKLPVYCSNKRLGYSMDTSRFCRRYREKGYEKLREVLRRMCCAPGQPDAFRTIEEVTKAFTDFLVSYCGNSYEKYDQYFGLPYLLEMPRKKQRTRIGYKDLDSGGSRGYVLLENDLLTMSELGMILSRRNGKITYIPQPGAEIRRADLKCPDTRHSDINYADTKYSDAEYSNRKDAETFEIRDGDVFFTRKKRVRFRVYS